MILVAGSGGAGLTAALAAAVSGARVLLVERAAEFGGTTALGGGRTWVPCNHFPENASDTREAARTYLSGLFDERYPEMIDAFLDDAPAMARFVEEHSPHRWVACPGYPDYHPERPGGTLGGRCLDVAPIKGTAPVRIPPGYVPMTLGEWERWRYPARYDNELLERRRRDGVLTGGAAMVTGLLDGVRRAGVTVRAETLLTGVERGPGGSIVSATLDDGRSLPVRAVILATGGFEWDGRFRANLPAAVHGVGAPPTNDGVALRIAESVGARCDNLGQGWWMPMLAVPGETLDGGPFYRSLVRERGAPRQIIVNRAGRRFANEAQPYNEIGKTLNLPGNDPAYFIFDAGFRRRYALPAMPPGGPLADWVARGDTPHELATAIGVDATGLRDSIDRWNSCCRNGHDEEFGRGSNPYDRYCGDPDVHPNPNMAPLDEPPYYAVRILAGTIGTKGGPITDTNGMVRTADGEPVPGLYAVGNASAFWTADGYPAPGATLAVGMTMGYRAGRHAAARTNA